MFQANIIYEGMVQGVGFRYTVKRFADELSINGWVRNLANGTVEVFAEGEKPKIDLLCQNIESYFETNITDVRKSVYEVPKEHNGFQIKF